MSNHHKEYTMLKTYHGSCHCQAVKFEVDLDLSQGTGKCNCTLCSKTRHWAAIVEPTAFRLLSGGDSLSDYHINNSKGHQMFCSRCGVSTYSTNDVAEVGGMHVSVQVMTLDDVTPEELIAAPIMYMDGRNDDWYHPPAETRHL